MTITHAPAGAEQQQDEQHADSVGAAAIRSLARGWARDTWLRHWHHAAANRFDGLPQPGPWMPENGCDCTTCVPAAGA